MRLQNQKMSSHCNDFTLEQWERAQDIQNSPKDNFDSVKYFSLFEVQYYSSLE